MRSKSSFKLLLGVEGRAAAVEALVGIRIHQQRRPGLEDTVDVDLDRVGVEIGPSVPVPLGDHVVDVIPKGARGPIDGRHRGQDPKGQVIPLAGDQKGPQHGVIQPRHDNRRNAVAVRQSGSSFDCLEILIPSSAVE